MYEGFDEIVLEKNHNRSVERRVTIDARRDESTKKIPKVDEKSRKNNKNINRLSVYTHKSVREVMMNLAVPPFFFYIPNKLEMQLIIRKACTVKSVNEMIFFI